MNRSVKPAPRKAVAERRRERQVEQTREDILRAAAAAFARSGYRAATMQQIAAEAGYTAGSLYTYFENKEAIFAALLKVVLDELFACFESASEGATFEARLELLFRRQFEVAERHREAFAFFTRLASGAEPAPARTERQPREVEDAMVTALARWLQVHARRAELGATPPEEAAYLLQGICQAFFFRWLRDSDTSLVEQAPRIVRLFLHGVLGAQGGG